MEQSPDSDIDWMDWDESIMKSRLFLAHSTAFLAAAGVASNIY
jgi:hypothetical protein